MRNSLKKKGQVEQELANIDREISSLNPDTDDDNRINELKQKQNFLTDHLTELVYEIGRIDTRIAIRDNQIYDLENQGRH